MSQISAAARVNVAATPRPHTHLSHPAQPNPCHPVPVPLPSLPTPSAPAAPWARRPWPSTPWRASSPAGLPPSPPAARPAPGWAPAARSWDRRGSASAPAASAARAAQGSGEKSGARCEELRHRGGKRKKRGHGLKDLCLMDRRTAASRPHPPPTPSPFPLPPSSLHALHPAACCCRRTPAAAAAAVPSWRRCQAGTAAARPAPGRLRGCRTCRRRDGPGRGRRTALYRVLWTRCTPETACADGRQSSSPPAPLHI